MNSRRKKVFIIAEAGCNHNGSIKLAKKLVDHAVMAGADAIKFQTFKTENLVTKNAKKAKYAYSKTNKKETQFQMQKKLELSHDDFIILKKYSSRNNILFLSSTFDIPSTLFLKKMNLEIIKIPSGEIVNKPNLEVIGRLNKKIILSTGMAKMQEISNAINILTKAGTNKNKITLLHCNSDYPSKFKDLNLKSIPYMRDKFGLNIGFSDHSLGIEASITAVVLGATVIEKHITTNKKLPGPDHEASINKDEFAQLVQSIRNVELSIGNYKKKPSKNELKNKIAIRKSIKAAIDIKKGEKFSIKNLTIKRPGDGLSPFRYDKILGKKAKYNFKKDQNIKI